MKEGKFCVEFNSLILVQDLLMHLTAVGLCLSQPGDIQLRCSAKEETHQLPLRPSPRGYLGRVSGSLGTPRLGGTRHLSISLILTYLMATTERSMYASFLRPGPSKANDLSAVLLKNCE